MRREEEVEVEERRGADRCVTSSRGCRAAGVGGIG